MAPNLYITAMEPESGKSLISLGIAQLLSGRVARLLDALDGLDQRAPGLAEDAAQHVLLRVEVVVEEPVRDTCLLGDVADPARVVPLAREDPHRRVQK